MLITSTCRLSQTAEIFNVDIDEHDFNHRFNCFNAYFRDWYEVQHTAASIRMDNIKCVMHILRSNIDEPRQDVLGKLVSATLKDRSMLKVRHSSGACYLTDTREDEQETLNIALAFAARLWLMVEVESPEHCIPQGSIARWKDSDSLSHTVKQIFEPMGTTTEKIRFCTQFTAANMEKIAGIQILWTSNLADHLALCCEDTKVFVFHQASVLEVHHKSECHIYPSRLIEEYFRTLALLLPANQARSRKWFQKKQKFLRLDPYAGVHGPLRAADRDISNFYYWRDRLAILKQTFDDSEPHSVMSWWYDDRKKVQWYTFWVAFLVLVLTVFFGIIQSAAAIVQAWAQVKALSSDPESSGVQHGDRVLYFA